MEKNKIRLHKFLADAGVCSRRKAEDLMIQKRVSVNGKIVDELGFKINPDNDKVFLDNEEVINNKQKTYLMLNKPKGCVTSVTDPYNRPTVMDYIKPIKERVFPIGRLDFNTEGLLLLTNDGEFMNKILHPSFLIKKIYLVVTDNRPKLQEIKKLENGVQIDGIKLANCQISFLEDSPSSSLMKVCIHEGRNKQIRKMFTMIGYQVIRLMRIQIGELKLGDLKQGTYRYLNKNEINKIF